MAHSRLEYLASQAEVEGITLGEIIAREMTPDEMDAVQAELASEIAEAYWSISDFMQDVEVPSIDSLLALETPEGFGIPPEEGPEAV